MTAYEIEVDVTVRMTRRVRIDGAGTVQDAAQQAEARVLEEMQSRFSTDGADVSTTAAGGREIKDGALEQPAAQAAPSPPPPAPAPPPPPPPPQPPVATLSTIDPKLAPFVFVVDKARYLALEALAQAAGEWCQNGNAGGVRPAFEALLRVQSVLPVPMPAA